MKRAGFFPGSSAEENKEKQTKENGFQPFSFACNWEKAVVKCTLV